ncbi:MAG: hypothetical protein WC525_10235 [Candidatus Thermoplasmatota archaeon]
MERLGISKMTGKLEFFRAINADPGSNPFCQSMHSNPNLICHHCYSMHLLDTARKSCRPAFARNSSLLSEMRITRDQVIQFYPGEHVRMLAHGELVNDLMFENLCALSTWFPQTRFLMWTKRKDIVQRNMGIIPDNMRIIYSSPLINPSGVRIPSGFNGVFNVFTNDYVLQHGIPINCHGKCIECMRCYTEDRFVTNELLRWRGVVVSDAER